MDTINHSKTPPPNGDKTVTATKLDMLPIQNDPVWKSVLDKVSHMGRVVVACPFGSQRYNMHTFESDMDMFIVYQASTSSLLGFNPPKPSLKSTEEEQYDYSILELHRFCELLLGGDPRCVETLFMEERQIYMRSEVFDELLQFRDQFLNVKCVEKYLSDACGARGKLKLEKWLKADPSIAAKNPLPKRIGKQFYIMIRLLQNAEDIVVRHTLCVFRPEESEKKKLLMHARNCTMRYDSLWKTFIDLEQNVRKHLDNFVEIGSAVSKEKTSVKLKDKVERWLVHLRYKELCKEIL